MKWSVAVAVIGLAALAGASPAEAQYFGQNKVQYEKFNFIVLKTEHFDIYYYPEEEEAGEDCRAHGRTLVRAAVQAARS